jgi:hypothetical protein
MHMHRRTNPGRDLFDPVGKGALHLIGANQEGAGQIEGLIVAAFTNPPDECSVSRTLIHHPASWFSWHLKPTGRS